MQMRLPSPLLFNQASASALLRLSFVVTTYPFELHIISLLVKNARPMEYLIEFAEKECIVDPRA